MNEKRFNFVGGYLYDGNKPIGHVEDIKFRQDFEDIVNALHDENEHLKAEVYILQDDILNKRVRNLIEENKQLKSEINMLKTTIGRNEGYIDRLTHKGEWR